MNSNGQKSTDEIIQSLTAAELGAFCALQRQLFQRDDARERLAAIYREIREVRTQLAARVRQDQEEEKRREERFKSEILEGRRSRRIGEVWVSPGQAAQIVGRGRSTVASWVESGAIEADQKGNIRARDVVDLDRSRKRITSLKGAR